VKVAYTEEEKKKIIERAEDYMNRKPNTTRNKVAVYSGVAISVLEKWGVTLPKPITAKQRIRKSPWTKGHMV
jgi:hypothetical protein|tara:strand:- start:62 stop:277 length:216 start_codon:yes stop_codon:yes gene_type:complete